MYGTKIDSDQFKYYNAAIFYTNKKKRTKPTRFCNENKQVAEYIIITEVGLYPCALLCELPHNFLVLRGRSSVFLYPGMATLLSETVQGSPAHVSTLWHGYCIYQKMLTNKRKT